MKKIRTGLSVRKKALAGDTVLFERKDTKCEGKVFLVRDNSVLVELSEQTAVALGYETQNTVVAHGKYIVKS